MLGQSCHTGLMVFVKLYVPYNIFRHICTLCAGYGANMSCSNDKAVHFSVAIRSLVTASKVFCPARFEGENFLQKRHFSTLKENRRSVLKYQGKAAVVVGEKTPILLEYSKKVGESDCNILCAEV